jgi:hypothetical protein
MSGKLTRTQIDTLAEIERSLTGRLIFGTGFGYHRVSARSLTSPLRNPPLVTRTVKGNGDEEFSLTPEGLQALVEMS